MNTLRSTRLRRKENNEPAIGVAVSDSPTGPFKDARGTPFITDGMTTDSSRPNAEIDPTVFIDDDGSTALKGMAGGDCRPSTRVEYLSFNPDGTIKPITQTAEGVSVPPKT